MSSLIFRDIELKRRRNARQFEAARERWLAKLVRFEGNLRVPNRPGYVYAQQLPEDDAPPPVPVLCVGVQARENLRVWIERNYEGGWEVAGFWRGITQQNDYDDQAYLPLHASDHEWPDRKPHVDAVNVHQRAIVPLRSSPGSSSLLLVRVEPYRYLNGDGTITLFSGDASVDLSGSQPAAGLARFVGIYLDPSTNTIGTVDGGTTIDAGPVTPDSPTFPDGAITSSMVRLDGSQSAFSESDFVDLRIFLGGALTGVDPAPADAQYLTLALDADLSAERVFVDGDNLTGADGGAGGNYTLDVDNPLVGGVDLNGVDDLVLDADGDTWIDSNLDDNIRMRTGGADRAILNDTGFAIDVDIKLSQTKKVYLDTDLDTSIYASGDDDPKAEVGGIIHDLGLVATGITRTVGPGKNHATIQAAVDWFKNKAVCGSCKIDVDAGSYVEHVIVEDINIVGDGSLTIEGDTRVLAGMTFMDGGLLNPAGLTNGGSGVGTITNAGAVITVVGAVTNPDFDADGWVNGDKVLVYDNAANVTEYTISATLNNTITLTVAAPAIGNDGTSICLLPDRRIAPTTAGRVLRAIDVRGLSLDGLYLYNNASGASCNGVEATKAAYVNCYNVAARVEDAGFNATNASTIYAGDGSCSAWECGQGFYANTFGGMFAAYSQAVKCARGYYLFNFGMGQNLYCNASGCTTACFDASSHSAMYTYQCYTRNNGASIGFRATDHSFISAGGGVALANNLTDYVPAPGFPPAYAEDANNFGVMYAT